MFHSISSGNKSKPKTYMFCRGCNKRTDVHSKAVPIMKRKFENILCVDDYEIISYILKNKIMKPKEIAREYKVDFKRIEMIRNCYPRGGREYPFDFKSSPTV